MSKKKSSSVPKIEVLILLVFFASFFIWAASKCGRTTKQVQESEQQQAARLAMEDSLANAAAAAKKDSTTLLKKLPKVIREKYTPLYVTINNLNLRKQPNLESDVILQLPLYAEVAFLHEVTDSLEEVNLGYEVAKEPWIKVKTTKGHIGWVYGAGVNYYKTKREGVME